MTAGAPAKELDGTNEGVVELLTDVSEAWLAAIWDCRDTTIPCKSSYDGMVAAGAVVGWIDVVVDVEGGTDVPPPTTGGVWMTEVLKP